MLENLTTERRNEKTENLDELSTKEILKIKSPKLGLLSNGEESSKGNEATKEAFEMISKLDSFVGNAEGNQVFDGSVDVVICDGFVGNILLKTSEGVADAITKIIKKHVKKTNLHTLSFKCATLPPSRFRHYQWEDGNGNIHHKLSALY